jgi:uncharacterized RDD family membrane protein YckC
MLNNIGLPGLIFLLYILFVVGMAIYAMFNVAGKDERFVYAGFWMRAIAVVIDTIVLAVVTFPVGYVFGYLIGYEMASSGAGAQEIQTVAEGVGNLLGIFIAWIYFSAMESSKLQATLGKKALGLRVVDGDGNRIGFGRATGRYFAKIFSAILLFVGYFMAGWTKRKRGLHDMMANTLVIKRTD